jgi:hypothetical protein
MDKCQKCKKTGKVLVNVSRPNKTWYCLKCSNSFLTKVVVKAAKKIESKKKVKK